MTTTVWPSAAQARDLRRRAGDVEDGERDALVDVVGQSRPQARFRRESLCRAPRSRPVATSTRSTASICSGVSVSDTSEAMRSPGSTLAVLAQGLADLEHASDEHAAAAGDGIVLLAALAHDLVDALADALRVEVALAAQSGGTTPNRC